jgi:hypothetical protein
LLRKRGIHRNLAPQSDRPSQPAHTAPTSVQYASLQSLFTISIEGLFAGLRDFIRLIPDASVSCTTYLLHPISTRVALLRLSSALIQFSRVVDYHDVVDALFAAAAADLSRSGHIFRSCTYAIGTELEPQEVITAPTDKECSVEEEYRFQSTASWNQQAIAPKIGPTII